MAPPKIYTWSVQGTGLFPFDMLRYDQCWPYSGEDAAQIERTTRRRSHANTIVNLSSLKSDPTFGRWESFGWKIR